MPVATFSKARIKRALDTAFGTHPSFDNRKKLCLDSLTPAKKKSASRKRA